MLAHPGTEEITVTADNQAEDGAHGRCLSRFQCSSSSARNALRDAVAAGALAITTMSHPPMPSCCWRKVSRMMRLILLRTTARDAAFFDIAKPSRG